MTRIFTCLSLYACLLFTMQATAQIDITANGGVVTAQYNNSSKPSENYQAAVDSNLATKYFVGGHTAFWIQYQSPYTVIGGDYTISSANDFASRDPKSWTLQGSNNGTTWTTLDTQTDQTFANRFQTNVYSTSNTTGYIYYRLNITGNNGSADTQLAEWRLFGTASGPAAPGNLTAASLSGPRISLGWTDNATNETGFKIERSVDGNRYFEIASTAANVQAYVDSNLSTGTQYIYRVKAVNAAGVSAPATSPIVTTQQVATLTDLTDFTNGAIADQYNTTGAEGIAKVIDNNIYSKYLARAATTWIRYQLPGGGVAKQYAITSGNDAPDRDPKNWTFEGSNDSTNWTVLNTQTNQAFSNRIQKRLYVFNNNNSYVYYRLNISANNGSNLTQLSELEIFGTGTGTTAAPQAPSGITAQAVSGNQVVLNWTDHALNETAYRLERSADSINWDLSFELNANTSRYYSLELSPFTTYYYRVRAENSYGNSAYIYAKATTITNDAPLTWQEHWLEHNKPLTRVFNNNTLSVYFDADVNPSVNWMHQDFTDVWNYVKQTYGTFSDQRLYMVFHGATYSGGHPANIFDASHDYRNVGDLGGTWDTRSDWNIGASVHEVGHIVEGASRGVHNSPAFPIWGDSKWCEIFVYDVYRQLGWKEDEERMYNAVINGTDNYPKPGTRWFKNWFHPIYTRSDSSAALSRYFTLLSQYFPQHNGEYTRNMNMGEFVHFWSGAAQFNLKEQADTAFGWTNELEMQFRQAQIDFPFTYPEPPAIPSVTTAAVVVEKTGKPVTVWPNPASGNLYLSLPATAAQYIVDVYSLAGVKVLSRRVRSGSATIAVSGLQDGLYIVTVSDNKRVLYRDKVVISNK